MTMRALVFPGQGSHSVGMLEGYKSHPVFTNTLVEASDILGRDIVQLISDGPESELNQTAVTQPVLLACSVAVYRCWQEAGGSLPDLMAGHSLGEYSALTCAGALDFAHALKLVAERGRLMQLAVPEGQGLMAAILGLQDEQVVEACAQVRQGVVEAVNFNRPGQVVIAGEYRAVQLAIEVCTSMGARKAVPLPVSVPAHSSLMRSVATGFGQALSQVSLKMPVVPVVHNVDAEVASSVENLYNKLVHQLYSPVQWTRTLAVLQAQGVELLLECGPGKVLCGLAKRMDPMRVMALETPELLQRALIDQDRV